MSGESLIITCQKCSEPLEASWERCPVCLTPTSSRGFLCPNCQSPIKETWKICPHCNTTLSGLETPTPSGPPSAVENSVPNKEQIYVSMIENEPVATIGFGLDLPITEGDMLGDRYRIVHGLGKGGFGTVYKVDDTILDEQTALKVVVVGEGKAQRHACRIRIAAP